MDSLQPDTRTNKQVLGTKGEGLVTRYCACPGCKRSRTLRRLPVNFKCADVICDFCGYLAQVKTASVANPDRLPRHITGAAWNVQKARMDAGIYFPLFIVAMVNARTWAIYFLSADLQERGLFIPRTALSRSARRAGWRGFMYDLSSLRGSALVLLYRHGRRASEP